jgi:drug/metabolite transporter (DMT)-like permease
LSLLFFSSFRPLLRPPLYFFDLNPNSSQKNKNNNNAQGMYGFRFPLLLTSCHMLFSLLALAPFMLRKSLMPLHRETLARQWKGFVAIGLFMALNISLNNSSLVEMTLSLNQVIRASIPVFTCVLAVAIEGKKPSQKEALSLLVLTFGVMIAVWEGTVAGSPRGVALCLAGTVSNALMMTTSGKVLSERVDALRLTFYTAPVSLAALAPAFLASGEASRFANDYAPVHGKEAAVIALATSAVALSYNVVHSLMIQRTSAVTTTVLGEAKIVGLLLLSYVILGEKKAFSVKMTVGCLTAIFGFCLYSHAKLAAATSSSSGGSGSGNGSGSRAEVSASAAGDSSPDDNLKGGGGNGHGPTGADVQLSRLVSEHMARGISGGALSGEEERSPLVKPRHHKKEDDSV